MLRREIVERERLVENCRRCGQLDLVPFLDREVARLRMELEAELLPEKFGRRAKDRSPAHSSRSDALL
jgi:hypothetical protein